MAACSSFKPLPAKNVIPLAPLFLASKMACLNSSFDFIEPKNTPVFNCIPVPLMSRTP